MEEEGRAAPEQQQPEGGRKEYTLNDRVGEVDSLASVIVVVVCDPIVLA